jgi:integrase
MKLTKRTVDALTYEGAGNAACYLWDDELPGFGCRVYPTGRKAFVAAYRVGGRRRFFTLGAYGRLTCDEARRTAKATLGDATRGIDPATKREQERQGETIRDLCTAYLERHAATKRSGAEDQRRIDRHILPAWGGRKARDITRADVAALHSRIGRAAPYEANRTLALLSKMFALAEVWGFTPDGHPSPARAIDRFREEKRDRWVTPEELPRLADAINREPNQSARHALWLYLLTGARKTELLQARWEDVDWRRGELRLPETKAGRVHYLPLSGPALALLRQIPRDADNPFILPGAKPGAHLVNISKPWLRVRSAAGVADVRLHDLRRTVGSWLAQAGNSLHLIGRVLNHSNTSTTAVYARFGQDQVREALEQHAQRLLGVAGMGPKSAEVVDITHRKAKD